MFTTRALRAGAVVRLFAADDWKFVRSPRGEELRMCRRFGIPEEGGFHRPRHWHRMSVGWYLNHSPRPSLEIVGSEGRALRSIPAGAELTIDYSRL